MAERSLELQTPLFTGYRPQTSVLLLRMVRQRRVIGLGAMILLLVLAAAVAAPSLAPYDPLEIQAAERLKRPAQVHPFGTDEFGRDILSRVLYGARLSLLVGGLVTAAAVLVGTVIGLVAGSSPRADRLIMRIIDGVMAFPDILLAIALMAALGPSLRNVVIALAFVYTPRVARVVRASVLVVVNQDYVEAARAIGAGRRRVLARHVLANCMSPIIVQGTFVAAYAMLGEAALSFLGVGVPPETPTWGGIIAAGQIYLSRCASCHKPDRKGSPPEFPALDHLAGQLTEEQIVQFVANGGGRMPGFASLGAPALQALAAFLLKGEDKEVEIESGFKPPIELKYTFDGYNQFTDPDGYPAITPPWGSLSAIDLNTGEYVWKIPLGKYPELAAQGIQDTGTTNHGGGIVTAGGLFFIGATQYDRKFRAFDKLTGKLLWETLLPYAGNATPATYEVEGRQYVVIAAGGGRGRPSGSQYISFAIP